jgi:multidrug transporter EmrE-like cation transporter
MNLFYGILWGLLGQVGSFMQFQGAIKYNWNQKYFWLILLMSLPVGYFYMKSVERFVIAFNGEIWPSRLIGFGLGITVFTALSYFLFKEPFTTKTFISLLLGTTIIAIQIFWK